MGLRADIFKHRGSGACSNHGISEQFDEVVIVNVEGPHEPRPEAPAVWLTRGNLPGTVKVIPAVFDDERNKWGPDPRWWMFGGQYVGGSDSRLAEAVEKILGHRFYGAITLHDRYEEPDPPRYDLVDLDPFGRPLPKGAEPACGYCGLPYCGFCAAIKGLLDLGALPLPKGGAS